MPSLALGTFIENLYLLKACRRKEALERQRNAREDKLDRIRKLVEYEDEEDMGSMTSEETRRL